MKKIQTNKQTRFGSISLLIQCGCVIGLVTASMLVFFPATGQSQTVPVVPSVLVVYDNDGQYGWLGSVYAVKLQNLLGHFEAKVTLKPLATYVTGDIAKYDATFYLGSVWNETPLPAIFQADIDSTTKTFVWMGVNLWRYAWDLSTYAPKQAFTDKYGFRLLSYSGETHPKVIYKDTELLKEPFDLGLSRVEVVDEVKAKVLATCLDNTGKAWPYIVQSSNFWFVGDMPMVSTTFENRSLAFQDLLHDMLGIQHAEQHRAYFRIEDVGPEADVPTLANLRQALKAAAVPFTISMIPRYRDWSGIYNNGIAETVKVTANSTFTKEMKLWVQTGGQVLQHGTTHQIDGLMNPYTGVSGDDYEFYRVTADAEGRLTLVGPLTGDSTTWARNRVINGQNILKNAGFNPVGWLTPHYLASSTDYKVFASLYPFACDRAIFFFPDGQGVTQATELNSPYIYRDTYGLKRIPESIGYIDPVGWYELQPPTLSGDLIKRAKALKVVRDGWAGFYFHWYLDPTELGKTITGLKELGYQFVPLNGTLK